MYEGWLVNLSVNLKSVYCNLGVVLVVQVVTEALGQVEGSDWLQ